MNNNNHKVLQYSVTAALFAALITVATAFIKFNTGINEGYLHFGDSVIYICACVLPLPYACLAAALGGFFADLLAGAAVWAPFTAVIKAVNVLVLVLFFKLKFNKKQNRIISGFSALGAGVSGVWTALGYFIAEGILFSFPTALTSIPFSVIQAVGSLAIFVALGSALDKINFKDRIIKR